VGLPDPRPGEEDGRRGVADDLADLLQRESSGAGVLGDRREREEGTDRDPEGKHELAPERDADGIPRRGAGVSPVDQRAVGGWKTARGCASERGAAGSEELREQGAGSSGRGDSEGGTTGVPWGAQGQAGQRDEQSSPEDSSVEHSWKHAWLPPPARSERRRPVRSVACQARELRTRISHARRTGGG
jgi:hypothetical protein